MARPNDAIKNLTTSFRITSDVDNYIADAAKLVGATKGELYRWGAIEKAAEIHNNPQARKDIRLQFAI